MSPTRAKLRQVLEDRGPAVIEGWYRAVQKTAPALRSASAARSDLSSVWDAVVGFLLSDDGGPGEAESIGAAFVSFRVRPPTGGRIMQVLLESLFDDLPPEVVAVMHERLPNLMAGIMTGLAQAAENSLLVQQEEIRGAYARALRRSEEELRVKNAGVESSINAIAILDLQGTVTYVNPAFVDMWGFDSDREVVGRHVGEFGEWRGDIEATLTIVAEQGGWMGELVAVRADGSPFDVQASVSPIQDTIGHPTQLMVFFLDITDRKMAQEALRRRAAQAGFLNRIGEEIAAERTTEGVLDRAVRLAHETFGFYQVVVLLMDDEREALNVAAAARTPNDLECLGCSVALGNGITGWAAQNQTTVVTNDISADPRYLSCSQTGLSMGSEVAVPICRGGEVIGVLDVQMPTPDSFGRAEQVVLETLADQIAVALENARLYSVLQDELAQRRRAEEALRRGVRRLETLREIDQAILAAKSKEEIAEAVVRHLQRLVPCQRVSIDLIDWEAEEVTVLAAVQTIGEGGAETGKCFPLTQKSRLSEFWQSRGVVNVPDARQLPQSSPLISQLREEGIQSLLTAPIGFGDTLMGVLTLGSDEIDAFEAEHAPVVRELADTAAIALRQAQLFDSVKQQGERLRKTMARLAEAEESERRGVVRELHDQVGQNLTALDLNLSLVRSQVEQHGLTGMQARIEDSLVLVEQTNERIRRLMVDLRPPVLDDYGLLSALHWYGDQVSKRTGIDVVVRGRHEVARGLSSYVENALFRITQEALNNAVKHACADEVTIALTMNEETIDLTISDNGVGFELEDLEIRGTRWGLLTMRERAESVGARCILDSSFSEGTRVVVEVPVGDRATEHRA